MSGSEAASSSSVMWLVVPFWDPRRWLGTLFAVAGIAASICTAVLPSILIRRVFPPSASAVSIHYRTPRTTLGNFDDEIPKHPPNRRSRTDDDIPLLASASASVPLRRSSSTGCIRALSFPSNRPPREHDVPNEKYLLPTSSDTGSIIPNMASVPFRALQQTQLISPLTSTILNHPPTISPENNSAGGKYPGDLNMSASSEQPSPSLSRELSQRSKISFHLPFPKPGGARRSSSRATSDIRGKKLEENAASEDESLLSSGPLSCNSSNSSSSASSSSSVQINDQPREPLQPRRKFLIFSRDFRFRKDKNRNSSVSFAHPSPASDGIPIPARFSWDGARPSHSAPSSPSLSPAANSPVLYPTTNIPPARPGRSDPYRTHGVPVPGSERSVAFLKAERQLRKQRMRSESETTSTRANLTHVDGRKQADEADEFGVSRRRRNRGFSWSPSGVVQQDTAPRKDRTGLRRSWQAVRPSSGDSAKDRAYNSDTVMPL